MKKIIINYKKTINLPNKNYPMKANLIINEPKILNNLINKNIYKYLYKNKKKFKKFIIHDGPPYANGNIHLGHAFNKIFKDIILKYKYFMLFNINYIPGWDCHGLPIELEIQKKNLLNLKHKNNINIFKKKCFKYAKTQINIQKKEFIRLGIIADWNNYYTTMNYSTISKTILILRKIIKLKLLKLFSKPTNWCINCQSSISDSEIEYQNKISKTIYVTFKIINKKLFLNDLKIFNKYKNIKLIIWTTTIWSLPANCALSIHPKLIYILIEYKNNIYILLNNKLKIFTKYLKIKPIIIKYIKGKILLKYKTYHPISNKIIPILNNKNIDQNTGTGIVHLASKHGEEDYYICKKYNIKGINIINKKGNFNTYKYIKNIKNCSINKAEKLIINYLKKKSKIILIKKIKHSYPFCWRHKIPIIIRSTSQWFITVNKKKIKNKLLKYIKKVKWIPSWGYNKMKKMIINRPDWCISRQRYWGVPITILIHKKTKKIHPNMLNIIKKISIKIKKHGPNYWTNLKIKNLIGKESKLYKKVTDVLDVWFDSGSTCFTILNPKFNKKNNIDLYVEGQDQYRGWFMSSLIINALINNKSPYKNIISHGFILDEKGKKMSKSSNNYIHPNNIIKKYGADILRLWVASTKFSKDINISNKIILRITESYRKIRNTLKFLINNLNNFNYKKHIIKKQQIILIDQWIIHQAKKTQKKIIYLYNKFKFYKVIKKIINFCTLELSSKYFSIIKDRKYTIKKNTIPVYSVQQTLWYLLETILKWISPILSFTAEETLNYLPRKKPYSIYMETWFDKLFLIKNNNLINIKIWKKLFIIKNKFNKITEKLKYKKKINSSLETYIKLYVNINFFKKIYEIRKELKFFFITSKLKLKIYPQKHNFIYKIKCKKFIGKKCKRCWHYVKKLNNNICKRCIINITGDGEKRKFI